MASSPPGSPIGTPNSGSSNDIEEKFKLIAVRPKNAL